LNLIDNAPTLQKVAPNVKQDVLEVPSSGKKVSIPINAFPPSETVKHSRTERKGKLKSPVHPVTSSTRFPTLITDTPVASTKRSVQKLPCPPAKLEAPHLKRSQ